MVKYIHEISLATSHLDVSLGDGAGDDGDAVHWVSRSTGKGKMMVEFFSALIEFRVCR